jgi:hypothetical protein
MSYIKCSNPLDLRCRRREGGKFQNPPHASGNSMLNGSCRPSGKYRGRKYGEQSLLKGKMQKHEDPFNI